MARTAFSSPRRELIDGIRAELPIALGVIPFGLIFGVLALNAGLPPWLAVGMSSIVFAGSSQFIGAQLIAAGTPGAIVVLTTLVVNLRHALYSLSLAPYLRHLARPWRWALAYLLTDEAYAVAIVHYRQQETPLVHKHWYFLGSGLTLWSAWQLSTLAGVVLGAQAPTAWSLDFTLPLTFLALIFPSLRERPHLAAAATAGMTAVLAGALPYKLGLLLAAVVGILVGFWLERRP